MIFELLFHICNQNFGLTKLGTKLKLNIQNFRVLVQNREKVISLKIL